MSAPIESFSQKNALVNGARFYWLYEVSVPSDPPEKIRLVRNPEPISFRGNTFSPFPITHEPAERAQGGDLPLVQITVSNITREIGRLLETHDGLVGESVTVYLVSETNLGENASPIAEESGAIVNVSIEDNSATFSVGSRDIYQRSIPKLRVTKYSCRHQYQDANCGYSLSSSNEYYLATCDKTLDGSNGCRAHGASYEAANLSPIHPLRFGGFPGLPTPNSTSVL